MCSEDDVMSVALHGHLIKVRLARVLPHPMYPAGLTDDDRAAIRALLGAENWCGFDEAAIADGVRVHAAFASAELTVKVVEGDAPTARPTVDGFTFASIPRDAELQIQLARKELWDLPPRGPKLICLANLHTDQHTHVELLDDPNQPVPDPEDPLAGQMCREVDPDAPACEASDPEPEREQPYLEPLAPACDADHPLMSEEPTVCEEPRLPACEPAKPPPEDPDWISLRIDGGRLDQLKLISVFPYAKFAVYAMRYGYALEDMKAFLEPSAEHPARVVHPHLAIDDVMDTDGIVRGLPSGRMGCVGANNMAVIDDPGPGRMVLGYRTRMDPHPHGLLFPDASGWQAFDKAGIGVFPHRAPEATEGYSESRRKIIRTFSWVEGPFDSINTYDYKDRLSWGIFNWISNFREETSGAELCHVLAYIHENYPEAFERCFAVYGFSVWFEAAKTKNYRDPKETTYTPYSEPTILFPGCHGDDLRTALTSMREAAWRNHRSLYATWAFRKAGLDRDAQRAQVEMFNLRIQSAVNDLPAATERQISYRVEQTVNPKADHAARRAQITEYEEKMNEKLGDAPGSFVELPRGRPFRDP